MANKKIINANPNEYNGIYFKSSAETRIYKALINSGIKPDYEANTFVLSPRVRASVPFYNRTKEKGFHLITEPISQVTYTPDFTFVLNDVFVIIEVKGFENDVFPIKRNIFRKYLETLDYPVMYFEIRNKRELLEALEIVKTETPAIQEMRKLILALPEKDIALGYKHLAERNFELLQKLVSSNITKIEKGKAKVIKKYSALNLNNLQRLNEMIANYKN